MLLFLFPLFFFFVGRALSLFGSCVYGFNISWSVWYMRMHKHALHYMLYARECVWVSVCRSALCLACWKLFELGKAKTESGAGGVWSGEWARLKQITYELKAAAAAVRSEFCLAPSLVALVAPLGPFASFASLQLYCKTSGLLATRRPH